MALLYLIRHPHTRPDPALPASAWDVSAEGQAQVRALLDVRLWRSVRAVYTSDQPKAAAVGEAVAAAYALPHHILPALTEAARESWAEPEAFAAAQRRFFAQPAIAPQPGWESAQAAGVRFRTALETVLSRHPAGESLAVVTHATVLAHYVAHLRGEVPTFATWERIGFAAIMAVDRATLRPLTDFLTAPYAGLPLPEDRT